MSFRNLVEVHRHQAETLGPRPALRYRRHGLYRDLTWSAYREEAVACAAALIQAGVAMGDRVGLLAENRVEWLVADMGIMTAGAINVPAHAGMPATAVSRQLADAGCNFLFVSTASQLAKARDMRKDLPQLKGVVVFDRSAAAEDAPSWQAFLQTGRRATNRGEIERRERALSSDDLATIMYTSGTTGNPKGVMLSHGNLLSNAEALLDLIAMEEQVILLSWLPLSHIFARLCDHYLSLRNGTLMALADSVDSVGADIQDVRPTHVHGVPRFWEKMLAFAQTSPAPDKMLRGLFGGRIRWLMSGGAPLPPKVCQAYRDAGLPLMQGYGLTESAPVLTTNRPDKYCVASAGLAIPGVELKIAPDGEILARGPNIMKGYWNQPEATAATVRDGWLYTGDLGSIDDQGFLYITGRKKELIVLSNGKKVAPTEVESLLQSEPMIEQSIVSGDVRNYLVAVIVPIWAKVRQALPNLIGSDEDLARNPAVRDLLQQKIDAVLGNAAPWEQVKKIVLRPLPFAPERGELTVSLKLKRDVIYKLHATEIEALYS